MRIHTALVLAILPAVAGCSMFDKRTAKPVDTAPAVAVAAPAARPIMGQSKSAAALDRTSDAEKAAALAAPAAGSSIALGKVVVALGPPIEGGLWLRAPVVKTAGKGRVVTSAGQSLAVDLQPGTGGAILSFGAFRALNLPLTDLPEVTVFAD